MIKIVTVVGARPQFIKAAAISRAIRTQFSKQIKEVIIHTGQHYDPGMSQVFFDELSIPREDYNLNAGSGSHAAQTAAMLTGIEQILEKEKPDCLLLYGDTNSTLAGSLVASKIHLPIVHVEGGVRFYKKHYPEEVNRIVSDHLSTLVFVPTLTGVESLYKEGFPKNNQPPYTADNPRVYHCGDIMYDNSVYFASIARTKSAILKQLGLEDKRFALVTMHRPSNVDDPAVLSPLFKVYDELARENQLTLVIPLHPRTLKALEALDTDVYQQAKENPYLKIIPAVSFLDMINLESGAEIIFTDSGGVQKEAYYFQKPCVIMLDETPWVELVESGSAVLTGADPQKVRKAYTELMEKVKTLTYPEVFGDGKAASFICEKLVENFGR